MELGHRPGRRTRHRPVAGACRRRQRGRQPRRRHDADVPRSGRDDACRAGAALSGDRAVLRHRELPQILDRLRQHPRRDAVLLAAVSRRHDAVTRVAGRACAGRVARRPAARDRRDGGVRRAAERRRVVRAAAAGRECPCGASRLPRAVPRLRDDHAVLGGFRGPSAAVVGYAAAARGRRTKATA